MSKEQTELRRWLEEVTDPECVADALVDALGGDRDTYLGLLTQDTTFVYLKR